MDACHKILVKPNAEFTKPFVKDEGIIVVHQDNVKEQITICLEEPLRQALYKWIKQLTTKPQTVEITDTITQIENVIDQMSFEGAKNSPLSGSSELKMTTIIPCDVKDYLSRYVLFFCMESVQQCFKIMTAI